MVYGTGTQSGQLLGCANIEPSLVAEEEIEISFPRNGTNPDDIERFYIIHLLLHTMSCPFNLHLFIIVGSSTKLIYNKHQLSLKPQFPVAPVMWAAQTADLLQACALESNFHVGSMNGLHCNITHAIIVSMCPWQLILSEFYWVASYPHSLESHLEMC